MIAIVAGSLIGASLAVTMIIATECFVEWLNREPAPVQPPAKPVTVSMEFGEVVHRLHSLDDTPRPWGGEPTLPGTHC